MSLRVGHFHLKNNINIRPLAWFQYFTITWGKKNLFEHPISVPSLYSRVTDVRSSTEDPTRMAHTCQMITCAKGNL